MNENKEMHQYSEEGDFSDMLADKIFGLFSVVLILATIPLMLMKMYNEAIWTSVVGLVLALIRLLIPAHSFEMKVWVVVFAVVIILALMYLI